MTERKIRSKRQAEASRKNGAKSAGPASKEGKEKSAQNSKKHGLTGKIEPSSTEQDHLDELLCKLHARYDANDIQQAILIERAVTAELRLIRARALITSTLEDIADPENPRRVAKQQQVALTIRTTRDYMQEMFGGAAPSLSLVKMVAEEAGWINAMPRANRATLTKLVRYAQRFRGERDRALIRLEAMIDYGLWRYRQFTCGKTVFSPPFRTVDGRNRTVAKVEIV